MLGMSLTLTKLSVFHVLGPRSRAWSGGLFAIYYSSVGTSDFQLTVGLPYLLLLVVGGLSTVGGTIIGALALVQFGWLNQAFPDNTFLTWFNNLGPGLIGIAIGRHPEGAWEQNVQAVSKLRRRIRGGPAGPERTAGTPTLAEVHELSRLPSPAPRAATDRPPGRAARYQCPLRRPAGRQQGQPRPAGRADHRPHRAERRGQDDAVSTSPPACRSPTRAGSSSTART